MKVMHTIKRAAALTGISEPTLRAWESRYGVGASRRTAAGYRLYDDQDLRTLRTMQTLVTEGWAVRAAADEALRRAAKPVASTAATAVATTAGESWRDAATERFVRAAADYDIAQVALLIDEQFGSTSFESVVDEWLLPALRALGQAWERGDVSVAGEHLAAGAVARRVSMAYDAAAVEVTGPRVVIGLAPGAHHDLGLLCFATSARRAGLATTYLGADVPVAAWRAAVAAHPPACVVLAIPRAEDAEATAATVAAMREDSPGLVVAVGGSAQDLAPDGCLRLGHRIGPAASLLAHALERRLTPG
jgi:methanogenic corrinoid protein MtbC1